MKKKLIDFLEEQGKDEELKLLRESSNGELVVRPSAYINDSHKLAWLIALLDEIYEIKQEGEEYSLVKKTNE
jgi:hypothetical protein